MNTQAPRLLRFADLREAGIVTNWPQLKRLVDNGGFPPGFMLSPAIRVFPAGEVEAWLQGRREASERARGADQVQAA